MEIITNKNMNYPFAAVVWIVVFFLLLTLCKLAEFDGNFWTFCCFVLGGAIAFGNSKRVPILTEKLLLFNGVEVKDDDGRSVWVGPGLYFTFWLWSLAEGEIQDMEIREIIVSEIKCQDKNGKGVTAEANGDWQINDHDKFKMYKADQMEDNLKSLIRRTIIRVCGKMDYNDQILGEQLGSMVLTNPFFEQEIGKYGIIFHNLIADGIATDLAQESLNSQIAQLFLKEKAKYGPKHKLTPAEIKEVNEIVSVWTKLARKIITNSSMIGRFSAEDDDKGK